MTVKYQGKSAVSQLAGLFFPALSWLVLTICLAGKALAVDTAPLPDLGKVEDSDWIVEKVGGYLPLDTFFVDENGQKTSLRSFLTKPVLLLPIYFYCPSSCSRNLANLALALNRLSFEPGRDYRVVALSFNAAEKVADARRAKNNYLKLVYDQFPAADWTFLTGDQAAIMTVLDAIGYRFKKMDDETFLHPSALVAIAADGKIVRYIYGSFLPGDIDIALNDAQNGTISMSVKRLLDFCLSYDTKPSTVIFQRVKIGVLLFFVLAGIVIAFVYRTKKKQ